MAIFANGWVLVKTCQMYCDETPCYCDETPCPLPAHSLVTEFKKRKVGGLYNSNSQKISQLETTSPNCLQVESGKLQSK